MEWLLWMIMAIVVLLTSVILFLGYRSTKMLKALALSIILFIFGVIYLAISISLINIGHSSKPASVHTISAAPSQGEPKPYTPAVTMPSVKPTDVQAAPSDEHHGAQAALPVSQEGSRPRSISAPKSAVFSLSETYSYCNDFELANQRCNPPVGNIILGNPPFDSPVSFYAFEYAAKDEKNSYVSWLFKKVGNSTRECTAEERRTYSVYSNNPCSIAIGEVFFKTIPIKKVTVK